jgi:hypothetical protein
MVRTASAKPRPMGRDRVGGTPEDPADLRADESCGADGAAVASAGTRTMVASSVKSRMPNRRTRIDASTRVPSDRRFLRSGTAVIATGVAAPTAREVIRAEPFESLGRTFHEIDDFRLSLTLNLGGGYGLDPP